jgi:UDP-2,3-diacylglucosamine pyrophosphatase LpxH
VTYVPGNHERVLWNFPALRRQITAAIPQIATFARALESPEYGVLARHGHEWDDNCHGWRLRREVLGGGRDLDRFASEVYEVMAIGEAVTAELMGGLIHHARALGASAPLVEQLKEVNNLRPTLDVFAWLEWLGSAESKADSQILHQALAEALDGLLASDLARLWDRITPDILLTGDLVDRLQQAKAVLLGPDFDSFKGRVTALKKLQRIFPFLAPENDQLMKGAGSEAVFAEAQASRGIQRVIYGHTHRARHDYFAGDQDGRVKMYINAGTYLPLIARALDGRSFVSTMQMSIVYLYRQDEDTERKVERTSSLDIWTGIRRKQYA